MDAALVQPVLRTMNTHFDRQMDTSTDAANHANEINILPEEEAKSDTDLPALAGEIESESDEEIQAKLKRSKGKKPKKKVLSDDSGDDSMEDQSHQNEGTGNGGKDREFGNESDEEDIIQGSMVDDDSDNEGNSFTKVHKKRARVLEDDSDDQDHGDREEVKTAKDTAKKFPKKENKGKYNDGTRKSRRKEKEEIGKRSDKGNAVKQLLNSRKKKRLKTFKEEGTATSSDSEEEVSKTKSRKKRKLKAKSQDEDVSLKAGDSSKSELDSDQELIQNKHDKIDNVKKTKRPVNDDKEKSDIENAEENHNSEKEESELSSCGSSIEDDIEQTNFKKSYGTRRKTAAKKAIDSEDKIEKAQQLKTNKILENTDLFEAESGESDDDNLKQNSDAEKDLTSGNKKNSTKKKKAKENRPRKPKKSELFESQSNQQKLLREQSVSIPEHRPAEVSIHQFLQRVPSLSSKRKSVSKRDDAKETVPVVSKVEPADQNKKSYTNSQDNVNKLSLAPLPMLSAAVDDVVLEFEADVEDKKENAGMSLLMKRLAKHTALPKHKQLQKKAQAEEIEIMESELEATQASKKKSIIDVEKIKMAAEIPGSGLLELKSQLQKRMKVVREVHRKEAEVRHKLENEDFDDEEEEWEEQSDVEEDSSDNDDVIGDKSKRRSGKNVKKNRESEDEDDDEIRKWNEEDERKQIENQIDEMEEFEKKLESSSLNRSNILRVNASHDENTTASARTASSSLDLFPGVNDEDESRADHSFNLELKDTIQWDETSTIPPGQGEFSKPSDKSRLEASTPFSKLLYGTRRYSSTSDEHSRTIHDDEFATKDSQFKMDTDESSRVGPILSDDLHFTLDENTQFSQILDTQGYINPRKPSKEKLAPKKLLRSEDPSMTQLLGLCSGNFEKDKSKSINMNVDDFGLPSDLPCDDSKTDGNSQEILDLCTGNFGTPAARIESPAKKGSVLEKLLNESDAVTSDTQIMELCSGTFSSAVESQVYGEPLIEESKSAGSLMKHFGEPKMDSYARKSFDNLFNADKRSTGTNEKELGSLDHGGLIMNDNESDVDPELLELCTGNFAQTGQEKNETTKSPMFYIGKKMKQSIVDDENGPEYDTNQKTGEDEDEGEEVSEGTNDTDDEDLHEGADGDASKNGAEPAVEDDCSLASSNARRGSDGEEEEEEIDEELQEYYETLPSKKFSKKRFYEEEAELSGSDVGEDDEDLGSEADEYEIDSDIEDLPSDARIQAQVHKAHMKATLEDDRQDIRRIQERFYEDGDLLSDGVGRRRNFRWRNIDRPLNDTVESVGSDNEDVDENENEPESHKEAEKRIARLEREAFLEEQRKAQETIILDEDSQCILNIIKDSRTTQETNGPAKPMSQKNSCSFKRQGSFLDRSKTTLSRLSSLTSTRSKPNVPTRSFVYQSKSSNDTPDGPDASKKIRRPLPNTEPPRPKKARIDRTLSQPTGSSIFSHL